MFLIQLFLSASLVVLCCGASMSAPVCLRVYVRARVCVCVTLGVTGIPSNMCFTAGGSRESTVPSSRLGRRSVYLQLHKSLSPLADQAG